MNMPKSDLQRLPSVDTLLRRPEITGLVENYGRGLTLRALRQILDETRARIQQGEEIPFEIDEIIQLASARLSNWLRPTLLPVINASGIILHTNLGRAPLSAATLAAIQGISLGYSSLEFDLAAGRRGKRSIHTEALLRLLTGAESALVVNNNAAALLLVLSALAKCRQVVIAHSQLVEIGGGFRVPDVMRQSGAKLHAVGTTNRVHRTTPTSASSASPPNPNYGISRAPATRRACRWFTTWAPARCWIPPPSGWRMSPPCRKPWRPARISSAFQATN